MADRKSKAVKQLRENKALVFLLAMLVFFSLTAPNFLSVYNFRSILKGASLSGIASIGFTIIVILGHLDLSIGAVLMLAGMLCIGLQPSLGWTGSFAAAVASGLGIGLINGLIVVKGRLNSFIVTLGTQIITLGLMHLYSGGGSLYVDNFAMADWLDRTLFLVLTPMTILTLLLVLVFNFFLNNTRWGRSFFVIGGSPETAWLAGLPRDRMIITGFVLSSGLAALGGAVFAMSISSMTSYAILGNKTLMQVISAVIIGGSLLNGGDGSIIKSYFGVLLLIVINNGIGCFGLGFEVQIFINGLILALVVLYESASSFHLDRTRGQKSFLIRDYSKKGNVNEEI